MSNLKHTSLGHSLGWFPEILRLGSHRIRSQARLLGLAALVGIVAGLGGIAFYLATRVVEHYALGVWAGYYPQPHPGGEPSFAWLSVVEHPFHPWLLLLIPTLGGIVSEMTGGYSLLLPSLWVCTLSFILSDEQSIYSSQVESRSRSPAHQGSYVREVLAGVRVNEFLSSERAIAVLHPGDPLETVLDRLEAAPHAILPVVDTGNRWLGVVNLEEVHQAFLEPALQTLACTEDLMRTDIRPLTPDDALDRALELFVENDLLVLPVVDDLKQRQVIGMVHRHEISSAYLRRVQGPTSTD